jgi:hypothetical protein
MANLAVNGHPSELGANPSRLTNSHAAIPAPSKLLLPKEEGVTYGKPGGWRKVRGMQGLLLRSHKCEIEHSPHFHLGGGGKCAAWQVQGLLSSSHKCEIAYPPHLHAGVEEGARHGGFNHPVHTSSTLLTAYKFASTSFPPYSPAEMSRIEIALIAQHPYPAPRPATPPGSY